MKKIIQTFVLLLFIGPANASNWDNANPFVDMMRSMLDVFEMMQLYQDFSGQIGHSGNPSQYRKYLPAYPSAPSPSLSQGQVPDGSLDGAWASQNRILLAIKQQYARMYWARDQYRDFYLEVLPEHLRFKDATTGQVQDFEFRMQDNQLALRDKKGRVIQFFRLNTAGESPAPATETTPNFWDPNVN